MKGLGRTNMHAMRAVAAAYPDGIVWSRTHIATLLESVEDPEVRACYANAAGDNGWSSRVLNNQIKNRTHFRVGAASPDS